MVGLVGFVGAKLFFTPPSFAKFKIRELDRRSRIFIFILVGLAIAKIMCVLPHMTPSTAATYSNKTTPE